jgi:nucleoside-diphosphate-sugar epimerase
MKEKITIIGGGWLGVQLAEALYDYGYTIAISSRDPKKRLFFENNKWKSLSITFSDTSVNINPLVETDVLIIGLPPTGFTNYPLMISSLLSAFSTTTRVIFLSSTGVYANSTGRVSEESALMQEHPLVVAENIILHASNWCILRLGGLIGPKRHPIHSLIKKVAPLNDGDSPVNLVHSHDVIQAIKMIVNQKVNEKIFTICNPEHPCRHDYYGLAARYFYDKDLAFDKGIPGKYVDGSAIENYGAYKYTSSIYNFDECK